MADKRIIELANEKLVLSDGDMTIVDSEDGTFKYDLNRLMQRTITDTALTVEGKPADAKAVGDALASVDVDTVNNARQLLSESYTLDQEPYHFRASGGDGADRVEECIVGGTVGWNQLMNESVLNVNYTKSELGITIQTGVDGFTVTVQNDGTEFSGMDSNITYIDNNECAIIQGHKYIVYSSDSRFVFYGVSAQGASSKSPNVFNALSNQLGNFRLGWISLNAGTYKFHAIYCDLTQMFGPTIADYIYSLEQSTAGTGVAYFRKLFPEDYYEYSAPTLKSVEGVSAKQVTGWNQWDEEWELGTYSTTDGSAVASNYSIRGKNRIKALPSTEYYFNNQYFRVLFYDSNDAFISYVTGSGVKTTPNNTAYIRFYLGDIYGTTYNHDICISLSDPTKNGQYEPYHKNIYPLDSTLTLRGIPKLTDGKVWFDGDKYNADGTVERRYGTRAYAEGDTTDGSTMITDGTTTVYKLTTPTTESATPYTALQMLDPNGTEKFVSTGIVPVGHESYYLENLRAKIEGLPKDFSTLIAPTEAMYKATRNYSTGDLLIVDNTLYKATANIANGGTITVGTNVTATTLAAVIAALA